MTEEVIKKLEDLIDSVSIRRGVYRRAGVHDEALYLLEVRLNLQEALRIIKGSQTQKQ